MKKAFCGLLVCLILSMTFAGNLTAVMAEDEDMFGYTCIDSNTSGDVAFNWIEIASTENQVLPPMPFEDVRSVENVPIGFTFDYYGTEYTEISIGLNGLLVFEPQNSGFGYLNNQPIAENSINGFIAPHWDSLTYVYNLSTYEYLAGTVNCQTFGTAPNRYFVVEWTNVGSAIVFNVTTNEIPSITFEAILYENTNDIVFQYLDLTFSEELTFNNNGISATVGIEDQSGVFGLEYSYNQQIISSDFAIKLKHPTIPNDSSNLYVSIDAPVSTNAGDYFQYSINFGNLGPAVASDVYLNVSLPQISEDLVEFVAASDGGIYDPYSNSVYWNIGSVSEYPLGVGNLTLDVHVPDTAYEGGLIQSTFNISTSTTDFMQENNVETVQTQILPSPFPTAVDVEGIIGTYGDLPSVYWLNPTVFEYYAPDATSVDIVIHVDDGKPDIVDFMVGPAPYWSYTVIFEEIERHGTTTVTYTAHYPEQPEETVIFSIYIDPAGYIYDSETHERISGAVVWLQRPNGFGGWENVPTGLEPAVMVPDVNPLITSNDGWYQWDTLEGTYRVHVEAEGYYPTNSRIVTVPPPVTDLHVGLVRMPLPEENAAPEITSLSAPVDPVSVNTLVSVSASFVDGNTHDTHSAVWAWADGTTSKGTVTEQNGVGTVTGGHIYSSSGVYEQVTLKVSDSNGGSVEYVFPQYIVIFDASAGFVSGGGWFNSPEGAYALNPELTGKANFGFVSKYMKGTTVPTGNTNFEFKVADLDFQSTSYQWLIIAGTKAQYKGTGTINGEGSYTFMLTAIDGKLKSEVTPDTIRIKIWDSTLGSIIYDNQIGLSDGLEPTTTLECGEIIIHK